MKIAQYNDMMSYLTRPGFKDGDTVVPPPKPLTESQVKDKLDLYIKGFIGGFDKMEMIDLMNKISKKADESGVMSQEDVFNFVQERKNFYQKFLEENKGEAVEFPREEFNKGTDLSKSAFRKPYAPEIEKRIIELANNDKLGAEAIADKLTEEFEGTFSRSPVGKRITALKAEGIIEDIPVKEKAASIAMRGDLYGQPAGEKYLKIREIRDVDRKAVDKSTGKSLYNIPENAKFKVNFGNTAANQPDVISNIPEKFRGVQYFTTKKAAEKALAERKKLKLIGDEDLDPVRKSANKKKYDLIKEVSNNNIEDKLAEFKKGEPLEKAHRLSLEQVKKTGQLYNVMDLGLDFDSPEFVQINNEAVKPFENKLKQLYAEQNKLYKQVKDLKVIPQDLRKKIEFNNKKISTVVDLAGGRVQGLQLDEFTLKPKVYGRNYANVLGFGLYDKPVKQLTKEDRAAIGAIMQGQVDNEKRTAEKTAQKLFANARLLNDVDQLATKGAVSTKAKEQIKDMDLKRAAERGSIDLQLLKDIYDKGGSAIGKGIKVIGSPAAGIGFALTEDNAFLKGASLLAPEILGTKGIVSKILNPFNVGRVMTPVGLPVTIGGGIYEVAKRAEPDFLLDKETLEPKTFDREDASFVMPTMMDAYEQAFKYSKDKGISYDDAVKELFKEKSFKEGIEDFQRKNFVVGGRVGYADGPDDPGKRKFMKIMGGLATLPIVGRFFKVGEMAVPVAEKAVETVSEAPKYFFDLVNKIKLLGKESKIKPSERVTETNYTGVDGSQYTLTEDVTTGLQRIEKDKIGGYADENVSFDTIENKSVMEYQPARTTEDGVEPSYYDEGTADFDPDGTVGGYDDGMEDDIIEQIKKEVDDKG